MNLELFETPLPDNNLLPYDGEAYYYGPILTQTSADEFFQALQHSLAWKADEAVIMGKTILTKRKVAWYGDQAFTYTYSRKTKTALPWMPVLLELKHHVESHTKEHYNACLANLYHCGAEGMSWHSDAERELKPNAAIASLSFGAPRKFKFKHRHTAEIRSLILEHGSLLVMTGCTQSHWLHCLPTTRVVQHPRINLTFRTMLAP